MSSEYQPSAHEKPASQLPEWEHEATTSSAQKSNTKTIGGSKAGFGAKLNRVLPPHRRYLGLKRNAFLWVLLAIVLALLALIIGLAAGLSAGSG
jgi:hypothetical protein